MKELSVMGGGSMKYKSVKILKLRSKIRERQLKIQKILKKWQDQ